MVIFNFPWQKNHVITNTSYCRFYIAPVSYKFDFTWNKNHIKSNIHGELGVCISCMFDFIWPDDM